MIPTRSPLLSEGENAEGNEKNQNERWGDDHQQKAEGDGTQRPWPGAQAGVLCKGHCLSSDATPGNPAPDLLEYAADTASSSAPHPGR